VVTTAPPAAATEHYLASAALAAEATRQVVAVQAQGTAYVASTIASYQAGAAIQAELAVAAILAEQGIVSAPSTGLNALAFTSATDLLLQMLENTNGQGPLEQLIADLIQSAGRAAEGVAVVARPRIAFVRYLTPPSCSRCVVLAGRVYRWSEGFLRHPNCDCVMLPTTVGQAPELLADPVELAEQGLVTGLSKADLKAIADGADFNQVVNVRRAAAGLREAGRALVRAGRPTPEAIYRAATSREDALRLLKLHGFIF
jgi:hypothetical protein